MSTLTPARDWRQEAACRGMDSAIFFPGHGAPNDEAKAVCARCPVRAECGAEAIEHGERFGVWGGMSERQRRQGRANLTHPCRTCGAPITPRPTGGPKAHRCATCRGDAAGSVHACVCGRFFATAKGLSRHEASHTGLRRYPLTPAIVEAAGGPSGLCRKLDVTPGALSGWRRDGLPAGRAGQLAGALGRPVAELWPEVA